MSKIIKVRIFNNISSVQYDLHDIDLQVNDYVMVDTRRGLELARVSTIEELDNTGESADMRKPLMTVNRRASDEDMEEVCQQKEKEALYECKKMVEQLKLELKTISAHYNLDTGNYTITFHASGNVNFRSLVGKLSRRLRARVELRQVGPRDEAKLIGGIGKCGLTLCCRTFLKEFCPVSIKMAKQQGLSLNPTKISGVCGRLLCCLTYENKDYAAVFKKMPKLRQQVTTPFGEGKVTELNLLKETVKVKLIDSEVFHQLTLNELNW